MTCEDEDRDEVMHLQAKKCPRTPADHRKPGERNRKHSASRPSEGDDPADTFISDF